MTTVLKYQGLIAPCGMNCGLCIGHLREKKPCGGCFKMDDEIRRAYFELKSKKNGKQ